MKRAVATSRAEEPAVKARREMWQSSLPSVGPTSPRLRIAQQLTLPYRVTLSCRRERTTLPFSAERSDGLIGYGPRLAQLFRDLLCRQVVKVLRGAKPSDLPIEQPTQFELVVNLETAKAMAHEIPAALVLRADKVIE